MSEHFVHVGRLPSWDSTWNPTIGFPFPDFHCSGFLWNGRSYSRAEFSLYLCVLQWQRSKGIKFLLRNTWHEFWFLRLCGLWASLRKGVFPVVWYPIWNGEDCTITLCMHAHAKMAMFHCSENTHYNFMFGKWNTVQNILSFNVKTADWDRGVIQIGIWELLQK